MSRRILPICAALVLSLPIVFALASPSIPSSTADQGAKQYTITLQEKLNGDVVCIRTIARTSEGDYAVAATSRKGGEDARKDGG